VNHKIDGPKPIIIKVTLLFTSIVVLLATIIDIYFSRPLYYIIVESTVMVLLLLIYYFRKIWIENEILIFSMVSIFCFIVFPILWLFSIGVSGSMPYYSFFLIVISMFILEKKYSLIVTIGIIFEVIILYLIELKFPSFFISPYDRTTHLIRLMISYAVVTGILVGVLSSIKKHIKSVQDELYFLSIKDELTNVYNRRYIIDSLSKTINLSERENVEFSILFIDINKFKIINDELGHDIGDKVLVELGNTINLHLRSYDVCARYGGDEFLIILPYSNEENSMTIADRISKCFTQRIYDLLSINTSLSIGITQGNGKNLEEIIRAADEKMYAEKKA